mmetsp:Transcript_33964/g.67269  ORF Transcript_33964/g.67269 Transcript_33964/m.67269 type:complete len:107 (-) Transcript_33964:1907-2227(-)
MSFLFLSSTSLLSAPVRLSDLQPAPSTAVLTLSEGLNASPASSDANAAGCHTEPSESLPVPFKRSVRLHGLKEMQMDARKDNQPASQPARETDRLLDTRRETKTNR